eukprot:scaffold37173_cov69-Phaeocystis_antarctica.AAC.2
MLAHHRLSQLSITFWPHLRRPCGGWAARRVSRRPCVRRRPNCSSCCATCSRLHTTSIRQHRSRLILADISDQVPCARAARTLLFCV